MDGSHISCLPSVLGEGPWVSKVDSLGRLAGEMFARSWWCLCPVLGSGWQEAGEGTPALVLSPNCLKFPTSVPKAPHILVRGWLGGTGAGGPGTWLVRSEWPSASLAGRVCYVAAEFVAWGQGWLAEPPHLFPTPHPSCKSKVVGMSGHREPGPHPSTLHHLRTAGL